MRRAVPAVIATVGGLALLANFHTGGGAKPGFLAAASSAPGTSSTTAGTTRPPSTTGPGTTAGAGPPPSPSTSTTTAPTATRQINGQVVGTQFGDVEVRVTISGGRITDVQSVELPFEHQRSEEISQQAAPLLHDEVLQAQSAQIDLISGATYTSEAYRQSLQAALDQARA
jgi:uncharacterized protein with FMN-binding domain